MVLMKVGVSWVRSGHINNMVLMKVDVNWGRAGQVSNTVTGIATCCSWPVRFSRNMYHGQIYAMGICHGINIIMHYAYLSSIG